MPDNPKLQTLVENDCLVQTRANELTTEQKAAIEALAWSQIYALVESRLAVGLVTGTGMI
jgi:hypothetical protein